jgi:peroxiredoxin
MEQNKEFTSGINLIGSKLPDMKIKMYQGGEDKEVKLSDYLGKWLILFFYPADFTFVCPTELKEMAESYPKFQELGAEVLSVSCDTVFTHKAWHDSSETIKAIKFPMAADNTTKLSKSLGVYIEEDGESLRGTFIVNPEGVIKSIEINDNSIGRSARELVRKLQAAQFVAEHGDQVCPASWQPGDSTLKPGMDLVGKI